MLVLAAYVLGEIGTSRGVPKVFSYLVAGMLLGPSGVGLLGEAGLARLAPVTAVGIAFIALLAGAELRWNELRLRGRALITVTLVEVGFTFLLLASSLFLLHPFIPPLQGFDRLQVAAFSILFASVAAVHSPAITIAILTETGARGPVARTTLGIVLLSDLVILLLFSIALSAARAVIDPAPAGGVPLVLTLGWEIAGGIALGALLGAGITFVLRRVGSYLAVAAVAVALLGTAVARLAGVEVLLTMLVVGLVIGNRSVIERRTAFIRAMERAAVPVFVVFFALSGARVEMLQIGALLPIVLPLALARVVGIVAGVRLGSRWAGEDPATASRVWLGLVSQAGVAIGMATVVADEFPGRGAAIATLLLTLIAMNELVGPVLFRRALVAAGETGGDPANPPAAPVATSGSQGLSQ